MSTKHRAWYGQPIPFKVYVTWVNSGILKVGVLKDGIMSIENNVATDGVMALRAINQVLCNMDDDVRYWITATLYDKLLMFTTSLEIISDFDAFPMI